MGTAAANSVPPPNEYQVKAAFLFNFIKFAEWPQRAFSDAGSPIIVGIVGKDPFGELIDEAVRGKTVHGRSVKVRRYSWSDDFSETHVLFVGMSERRRVASILGKVRGKPVLTVGEVEDFADDGGVINFLTEKNKIRFQINVDAAKEADLKLHSSLLNLARIVRKER